ncbi:MAG: pentapeptide repeat-containing protein, partial [Pseudolabrys sp.]
MTGRIIKALVATVSLAALVLGTGPSLAHGHGGGGRGGGGGHHFGGGGAHFSGAHFSGARFSGARMGRSRFSAAHISGRNFSRISRGNFAHVNAAHVHGLGAAALGTRAAWNHGNWNHGWNHWGNNWRGGWNGGCCGGWWFGGPVFWPFFAGDLLAFTFWPWGFYDPFWAYGSLFVWDAMFWPGPQYTYGPYGDVYGGYASGGPARTRVAARRVTPETTGSVTDSADLA